VSLALEVRGFLGQIEPWLRSGWVIPARRPSLYPNLLLSKTPSFFARIDEIKKEFGLYEMVGGLANEKSMLFNLSAGQVDQDFHCDTSANIEDDLRPVLAAQKELRGVFFRTVWPQISGADGMASPVVGSKSLETTMI